MNKKVKSILIAGAVFATAAALAIGGSLAYLVDTDEDVNVMTLGNIEIDQIEEERDDNGALVDYTQGKPLYPTYYEGSSIPWAPADEWVVADDQAWKVVADNANVIDKFVTVENTGDNAAYVRTIFAVEVGEGALADPYVHLVTNGTNITEGATWEWEWLGNFVDINGATYAIAVATYTEALPAGETTIPSLKQVYLDKEAGNEEVASLGDDYKIYAYTQAVQSDSFTGSGLTVKEALDEAFYTVTAAEHPWVAGVADIVAVATQAELDAALANGETSIILAGAEYTLPANLSNVTLIGGEDGSVAVIPPASTAYSVNLGDNVTLKDLTISAVSTSGSGKGDVGLVNVNGANVVIDGCSFDMTGTNNSAITMTKGSQNTVIKNCDFTGGYKHIGTNQHTDGDILIENCTFGGANSTYAMHLNVTSNDVTIKDCTIALFNTFYGTETGTGVLTFENCDFVVEPGKTNVVKLYRDAIFTDCDFEDGFLLSGSGNSAHDFDMTFNGGTWEGYASIKDFVLTDSYSNDVTATFDGISYVQTAAKPGVWTQQ